MIRNRKPDFHLLSKHKIFVPAKSYELKHHKEPEVYLPIVVNTSTIQNKYRDRNFINAVKVLFSAGFTLMIISIFNALINS